MTWDRRLYFPSEGRYAEDFFPLKNPMALAGFEPANLGTKGQHATPRPLKLLTEDYRITCLRNSNFLQINAHTLTYKRPLLPPFSSHDHLLTTVTGISSLQIKQHH